MIRFFDIFFSLLGLFLFFPLFLLIFIIGEYKNSKALFKQPRVGYKKKVFIIYKFRTMKLGTKFIPTHLQKKLNLSSYNIFLRKTKLDELPQLWNVLKGDMTFVGYRPCLFTQKKLINYRKKLGIFKTKPGITGLAQILNIDMSKPVILSKIDFKMINKMNVFYYFYYILLTFFFLFRKKL
jgi:O-antigen biosynthesis protein WbqP